MIHSGYKILRRDFEMLLDLEPKSENWVIVIMSLMSCLGEICVRVLRPPLKPMFPPMLLSSVSVLLLLIYRLLGFAISLL